MNNKPKFILSGGGTGGHIYPAIAIANQLKERFPEADILFVGAKDKMEMQKVPQAGYPIKGLWIAGLQRKVTLQNAMFPFKLLSSLFKSFQIIQQFKPDVVIGTGGFASGAVLKVAQILNIPTVIQEQNSFPGITNKWLAKKASAICVAYNNLETFFPANKIIITGNPVRQDLLLVANKRQQAQQHYQLNTNKQTLLVLGGSLGAKKINQLIATQLDWLLQQEIQIIWQCGNLYSAQYQQFSNHKQVQITPFIDKMDLAYAAADIIISRSGASSVSELCIVGKPVLFIPSPNVAEDHQTKNAQAIVDKQAAIMLQESNLDTHFKNVFQNLLLDKTQQQKLSNNIKQLALPNATNAIVDAIIKLVPNKSASNSN